MGLNDDEEPRILVNFNVSQAGSAQQSHTRKTTTTTHVETTNTNGEVSASKSTATTLNRNRQGSPQSHLVSNTTKVLSEDTTSVELKKQSSG